MTISRADWWIRKNGRLFTVGERLARRKESDRRYRENHPDKLRVYRKKQYDRLKEIDPERMRRYSREYYLRNREKCLVAVHKYQVEQREKIKLAKQVAYRKKKTAQDELQKKKRCIGCTILLQNERMVCDWCLKTYPQKYATI